MHAQPTTHHVFIDFENVHDVDLSIIGLKSVVLTILLGPKQTKLSTALVEKLLTNAGAVHLIRLASSGRNAVDFALAYYVGRHAVLDPAGTFHIISQDSGYDPLIEHLRDNQISAHRHADYPSLAAQLNPGGPVAGPKAPPPASVAVKSIATPRPTKQAGKPEVQPPVPAPLGDRALHALEHLRSHSKNRPAREKTLVTHMVTLFGNKITEQDAATIVQDLRAARHIEVSGTGRVTYKLPPNPHPV